MIASIQSLYAQSNRSGRNDRLRERENNLRQTEETTIQPCMRYDDDEYFAGSGYTRVKAGGEGERDYTLVINKLLNSVRQQVKQKIGGQYKAVVRDYFDQMDYGDKISAASHIESAGEEVIDRVLGNTEEDCRTFGEVDEAGYQNIYIGILVKKSDLVNSLLDGIENDKDVPADIQQQVRQNEKAFRDSAFKIFEQGSEKDK
jgi:hypothetical protein